MRVRRLTLAAALGLLVSGTASAGPLVGASFTLEIGILPATTFVAAGATGTATSNLSATLDGGAAFAGTFTHVALTSIAPPLTELEIDLGTNAPLAWSGAPASAGFQGFVDVRCCGGITLLGVPLDVGNPGAIPGSSGPGVSFTAISAAWTTGTVSLTGLSGPLGSVAVTTRMGANGLTAGGAGTLVLVTPVKVLTNLATTVGAFGVLTLTYVPEPGTLGLLGLGMLALALGRRRLL
jgi:hypothetical protein